MNELLKDVKFRRKLCGKSIKDLIQELNENGFRFKTKARFYNILRYNQKMTERLEKKIKKIIEGWPVRKPKKVGDKLREERLRRKMTRNDFAEYVTKVSGYNVSGTTVKLVESNQKYVPDIFFVAALSRALGKSIKELFELPCGDAKDKIIFGEGEEKMLHISRLLRKCRKQKSMTMVNARNKMLEKNFKIGYQHFVRCERKNIRIKYDFILAYCELLNFDIDDFAEHLILEVKK